MDVGIYLIVVLSCFFQCTTLRVPHFTEEPHSVDGTENPTVQFHCQASRVPDPNIKWNFNMVPITKNPRWNVTGNSLVVYNVTTEDAGFSGCNDSNGIGFVYKNV
jgi:hypothetical protein